MTTTKFSEGDRVRVYDGTYIYTGSVVGFWADGLVRTKLDRSGIVIRYHPKQLRRLKRRTKVVWESRWPITEGGCLDYGDIQPFEKNALSKFIGKRVRIVITEAK